MHMSTGALWILEVSDHPEAGVTGNCELLGVGPGDQTQIFGESSSTLSSHWAISAAPVFGSF